MDKDGVVAAFELIIEEINAVAADIAEQGSRAFRDKAYDVAQRLGQDGKSLQEFRMRVESLLEDWKSGIDVSTRQRFTERLPKRKVTLIPYRKAPKTRLRVQFSDGTLIQEYYAADTFALALEHFGLAKVEALGLTEVGLPLVGRRRNAKYGQRRIGETYICTHSSTKKKKETLEKVGKSLGVNLKVEIIQRA